jgi:hypothetical protein
LAIFHIDLWNSELISFLADFRLLHRIVNLPQIEGDSPAPFLADLWRSFVEKDNVIVLMPNLIDIHRTHVIEAQFEPFLVLVCF